MIINMEFMKLYIYQTTLTNLDFYKNNSFFTLNFLVRLNSVRPPKKTLNIKVNSSSFGFSIEEVLSEQIK